MESVVIEQRTTTVPKSAQGSISSLMTACQTGNVSELRQLLQSKPSLINGRDRTGKTPLHYCSENRSLACAEELLSIEPSLVDSADEEGYTALHLAVINGNKILVQFLISKNADVNAIDHEKHSLIHWATVCGEIECLDLLIAAGANSSTPDMHGAYPLHYAAQMCGPKSEVGYEVKTGMEVLKRLLFHGADVRVRDQDGREPLLWAASAGSSDGILALINASASVKTKDKDGLTALHCAASRGHNDVLETLLSLCGMDVDVEDNNGCTPLFYAVTLGHADCTALLLRYHANPNHQDLKGRTPAHCGAAKGQLETLKILEKHMADLWKENHKGDLPLHEAVQSGRKELVLWLLSQRPGAPNYANKDGRTCLHIAAINNNVELCKILIDDGVEVNPVMKNNKGQMMTPMDAALFRGNRGCANYLQLHGGRTALKVGTEREKQSDPGVDNAREGSTDNGQLPGQTKDSGQVQEQTKDSGQVQEQTKDSGQVQGQTKDNSQLQGQTQNNDQLQGKTKNNDEQAKNTDNGQLQQAKDSGQLRQAKDSGQLHQAKDSGQLHQAKDSGQLHQAKDSGQLHQAKDIGELQQANDSGQLQQAKDSDKLQQAKESGQLQQAKDSDKLQQAKDSGQLRQETKIQQDSNSQHETENGHPTENVQSDDDQQSIPSKPGSVQTEYLSDEPQQEYLQQEPRNDIKEDAFKILENSDHENEGEGSLLTNSINGRRLERIPEEERDGLQGDTNDEEVGASGVIGGNGLRGKKVSGASSVASEDTLSIGPSVKDSGFSDNNRLGWRSDLDDSDILSSPAGITFIDNGEIVKRRPRRRNNNGRKDGSRAVNGGARTGADSESDGSISNGGSLRMNGLVGDGQKMVSKRNKSKGENKAIFRPKTGEKKPAPSTSQRALNNRLYQKERRIFQELLELKRVQLNSDKSEEEFIVHKLSDSYRHQGLIVDHLRFDGPYTFQNYEKYLYEQLRQLSGQPGYNGPTNSRNPYDAAKELKKDFLGDSPSQCTQRTYHCHHATHTYMGVPCVAYLKNNRGPAILPKINAKSPTSNKKSVTKKKSKSAESKEPVVLEIKHGDNVQTFSLPTEQLDKNKKYQLTFTLGPSGESNNNNAKLKPMKSV